MAYTPLWNETHGRCGGWYHTFAPGISVLEAHPILLSGPLLLKSPLCPSLSLLGIHKSTGHRLAPAMTAPEMLLVHFLDSRTSAFGKISVSFRKLLKRVI